MNCRSLRYAVVVFVVIGTLFGSAAALAADSEEAVFQTSTIAAFLAGLYDGPMTCTELLERGDTGLGTFNGIDGEMIVSEGHVFQAKCGGVVAEMDDSELIPFAMVTFFDSDIQLELESPLVYSEFEKWLDTQLPTLNMIYAIRVEGSFQSVKARSIPKQVEPYEPFVKVAETQSVYKIEERRGLLVGFRFPSFAEGINVPGYHLHFLDASKSKGGHVLDFVLEEGLVHVDLIPGLYVALPETEEFFDLEIDTSTLSENTKKAEK